ncbi:MAG: SagB/ThcOx family dehydrogenase [Bacteroidales bacterium]|jgi:SagB-type dehydrogenase family enzyme|nr:SagB/ThcOx family dehydrogenase [Bacteroidales bacterium]
MFSSVILFCALGIHAQDLKVIQLNVPDKTRGSAVMKALSDRQSAREYATKSLQPQDLSDLLWAANGVNRADGKRTAPSCRDFQDVEVYVILPEGAYLYDARAHALNPISAGDYRGAVAGSGQDFAKTAPLSIVLVADMTKYGNMSEGSKLMAAVDVGIVCQNINVACAGLGLATVPRASMNQAALKTALKLTDKHLLLMNNPIGYPKK